MRFLICLSLSLLAAVTPVFGAEAILTVEAGRHDRDRTPIAVELPEDWVAREGTTYLLATTRDETSPNPEQRNDGDRAWFSWILEAPLPAGESRRYEVIWQDLPAPDAVMKCVESEASITITSGNQVVLNYVKTPTPAASENDSVYTRTGYLHPVNTPTGKTVTGDYPEDHPHQHALFNAWTKTTFEDRALNFWDQKQATGRIAHARTGATASGPVFAQFTTEQRHEDITDPEMPNAVLDETWLVRVYQAGDDLHLFDLKTTQRCASESPLVIEKYHYGGMAFRGNSEWFNPDKKAVPPADFLTGTGLGRIEGNHSRENWVALSGPAGDSPSGIAIFSHPGNFRAPQWVRLHPSKPYFVFTPQVEQGFAIEPGKPYTSHFRYAVFDGTPDPELLESIWNDFAHPPKTTFAVSAP